ncbi:MAG: alpha/beta hydrolase [Chloroflexota bacterium]
MTQSANQTIHLYDGPAPGSETWTHTEQELFSEAWQTQVVFNVTGPTLTVYTPDPAKANGTAIVICPGGGFHGLSINSEGADVAHWLANKGLTCFVLKYRLVKCAQDPAIELMQKSPEQFQAEAVTVIPLALADGQEAMRYVRSHADEYNIDANRIGIIGFSAGGTVAAAVGYNDTPETRPNFIAPIYLHYGWVRQFSGEGFGETLDGTATVPEDAAPMFLLAATDDEVGLAPHSIDLYNEWVAAGKSAELHLYATGGHGFGLRAQGLPSDRWIELFADWLGVQGMIGNITS